MRIHRSQRALLSILLALPISSVESGFAQSSSENDGDLLQAHLQQAQSIKANDANSGMDAALKEMKREIAAKVKAWTAKMEERELGDAALLEGISRPVLQHAHELAVDVAKTEGELKQRITLEMLLALVAERNPDVKTSYEHLRATLRHYEQAAYLEDLVSQYRAFARELDTQVGPQTHKEEIGKTFPFPSVLALKGQLVDLEAEGARLEYLQAVRNALNQTANEFFEVQSMYHELAIVQESRELYLQLERSIKARLESGNASQADLLKAQSVLAALDDQIKILTHHSQHHATQINILLAISPHAEWGELIEADLKDENDSATHQFDTSHRQNQELLKAQNDVAMQETMVRMAETMLYPLGSAGMSQISLSEGAEAGPTRNDKTTFPAAPMVDARMAGYGANAAYIDELRIHIREAKEKQANTVAKTDLMVDHSRFTLRVARQSRSTYASTIVPKSQQAFEAQRKRFASGDGMLADVLEAGRMWQDDRKMLNDLRRDQNKDIVDTQDAQGLTVARLLILGSPAPKVNAGQEHLHD